MAWGKLLYQPGAACRGFEWVSGPGCPWGCRTSAPLLLAGDLSSSLSAEGLGAELALGTGCSFCERWELF